MKKINIVGSAMGQSGYDSHTRSLANALYELGFEVRLDVPLPQNWPTLVNDAELNMITKPFNEDMTTIAITTPPYWRLYLADNPSKFAGFLVWEGDKIPKFWIPYLLDERVDYIFVPSNHTRQAILNTLSELLEAQQKHIINKIYIIPHGVDRSLFVPQNAPKDMLTFLMNKGWNRGINDRGGIQWGLKAFSEAFTNKDNVQMKIKINSAYCFPGWNFVEELKKLNFPSLFSDNKPMMMVNSGNVEFKEIPKFYAEGDVFISLTMGEAFNLPCLEALSCGLPVITTDFGGQTDYVNNENGWIIPTTLVDSQDPMYEGIKWGMPDIEVAKKVLKNITHEEIERRRQKAIETAEKMTWKATAEKIREIISS